MQDVGQSSPTKQATTQKLHIATALFPTFHQTLLINLGDTDPKNQDRPDFL